VNKDEYVSALNSRDRNNGETAAGVSHRTTETCTTDRWTQTGSLRRGEKLQKCMFARSLSRRLHS